MTLERLAELKQLDLDLTPKWRACRDPFNAPIVVAGDFGVLPIALIGARGLAVAGSAPHALSELIAQLRAGFAELLAEVDSSASSRAGETPAVRWSEEAAR